MALSSASGPSTSAPVIWPRSTILHSAAASMVDGTFGLTVSIAERMATRTSVDAHAHAPGRSRSAGCRPCPPASGAMLTAASVMISASVVAGHVHHEAVADAPRGAQAGVALDHGGHQFVGVQAALHQRLGLALAHQLHRRRGGRLAVGRVDDLDAGQVDAGLGGDRQDARARADQDRHDQAQPCRPPSPPPARTRRKDAPRRSAWAASTCRRRSGVGTSRVLRSCHSSA